MGPPPSRATTAEEATQSLKKTPDPAPCRRAAPWHIPIAANSPPRHKILRGTARASSRAKAHCVFHRIGHMNARRRIGPCALQRRPCAHRRLCDRRGYRRSYPSEDVARDAWRYHPTFLVAGNAEHRQPVIIFAMDSAKALPGACTTPSSVWPTPIDGQWIARERSRKVQAISVSRGRIPDREIDGAGGRIGMHALHPENEHLAAAMAALLSWN